MTKMGNDKRKTVRNWKEWLWLVLFSFIGLWTNVSPNENFSLRIENDVFIDGANDSIERIKMNFRFRISFLFISCLRFPHGNYHVNRMCKHQKIRRIMPKWEKNVGDRLSINKIHFMQNLGGWVSQHHRDCKTIKNERTKNYFAQRVKWSIRNFSFRKNCWWRIIYSLLKVRAAPIVFAYALNLLAMTWPPNLNNKINSFFSCSCVSSEESYQHFVDRENKLDSLSRDKW